MDSSTILGLIQSAIVILGVPVGIYTYWATKKKDRYQAELTIYEKLDDRYWTYQQLCMAHPQLDVSDVTSEDPALAKALKPREQLTIEERLLEREIMYLVIALAEHAFVLYKDSSTRFQERQWKGWNDWIGRLASKASFHEALGAGGSGYDTEFEEYINSLWPGR